MKRALLLVAGLAAASLSAQAFAVEGSAGFMRAEIGHTSTDTPIGDASDTAWSIRGGYFFNGNVAIEGFYTNHGEDDVLPGIAVDALSIGVGVVGKKNFGGDTHQGFFIAGRAGVAHTEVDLDVFGQSDSDNKLYGGVGIGYDFNKNFGLSLNADYHKVSIFDDNVDFTTVALGAEYRF